MKSLGQSEHPDPLRRKTRAHVVIVGGGFTGLAAAWDLVRSGHRVTVLESESRVGGLAGAFPVANGMLEKFYHHWFTNDAAITRLIGELGLSDNLVSRQSRTGMYYAQSMFRLSKPLDLLKFSPLPFWDRIRLALLLPKAAMIRDWRQLESITAREWLLRLCGENVFRVVWEPLMRGKFGLAADEISAVWLWNKLCLRGGSRDKNGNEVLLYYKGGFAALSDALAGAIVRAGGEIICDKPALSIETSAGAVTGVVTEGATIRCDALIVTTPLPTAANLLEEHIGVDEAARLRRIRYLANVCLVLQMDRSLSDLYWINVNDPSFPFVGIIEHTNFEPPANYGDRRIAYLSRYLPVTDPVYAMDGESYLEYAIPYIKKMFPEFKREWVLQYDVWRAEHAQPIVERNYSSLIPGPSTSIRNAYICSMAQIYPEDRGTNYAVQSGRAIATLAAADIRSRNI